MRNRNETARNTGEVTVADITALTTSQKEVLGLISINMDRGHSAQTLKSLVKLGYITPTEVVLEGYPPVKVVRYSVPTPVHMAWCQWCSENCEDFDDEL